MPPFVMCDFSFFPAIDRSVDCACAMQNMPAMVGCVPVHASSTVHPTDDRVCFLCGAGPDGTGGGKEAERIPESMLK